MKLIIAIVNKEDSKIVNTELVSAGYTVTKLATTGGFLMSGNMTMIIGTEDEKVDACIKIISDYSSKRNEMVPAAPTYGVGSAASFPLEVTVGGATVFVLDVDRFEKL